MAIYHLSVKAISRSAGRSATAAAAYRAADRIEDRRTGEVHDYTRRRGVEGAEIVLPKGAPEWAQDRAQIWNAVEESETRKNSTVARENEVALPAELSAADRRKLARDFAAEVAERHGVAADVAIHQPGKGGDSRNYHAHILVTTRRLKGEGFTEKTREWNGPEGKETVQHWRARWAELVNERLQEKGIDARVDHRSLEEQGIERVPTRHLGPAATGYERRTGEPSRRSLDYQREVSERLEKAVQAREISAEIIDTQTTLSQLFAERERLAGQRQMVSHSSMEKPRSLADTPAPSLPPLILPERYAPSMALQPSGQEPSPQPLERPRSLAETPARPLPPLVPDERIHAAQVREISVKVKGWTPQGSVIVTHEGRDKVLDMPMTAEGRSTLQRVHGQEVDMRFGPDGSLEQLERRQREQQQHER